ncbi:hypothetical protein ACOMHN_061050 [Nucella lapillus]
MTENGVNACVRTSSHVTSVPPKAAEKVAAPPQLMEAEKAGNQAGQGRNRPGPGRSITERGPPAKSAFETQGYVFEATTAGALAKEAQTLVGDVCVDSDMVVSEDREEKDAIKKKAICRSEPSVLNNS